VWCSERRQCSGLDEADYSSSGSAITGGTISGTSGTINQGADTDTLSGIEEFRLTSQGDLLTFDIDALVASVDVTDTGGSDTIYIVDGAGGATLTSAGIDGGDFASMFFNIEKLDFSGTDLTGGDTFDIGNANINDISGGTLEIDVDQAKIALADVTALQQSGALITSDSTIGSTRTVNWDDGMTLILNG
jgi:hypothetical protein